MTRVWVVWKGGNVALSGDALKLRNAVMGKATGVPLPLSILPITAKNMDSRVLLTNKQTRIWFSKNGESRLA